jgi:hypothetical protein
MSTTTYILPGGGSIVVPGNYPNTKVNTTVNKDGSTTITIPLPTNFPLFGQGPVNIIINNNCR